MLGFTLPCFSFILCCSSGVRSLEALCLQVTDLLPGLRRLQTILPEHGCLIVSPGNYWQNQRELFDTDPDLLKTVQQHEPKGLHVSATLKGGCGYGYGYGRGHGWVNALFGRVLALPSLSVHSLCPHSENMSYLSIMCLYFFVLFILLTECILWT